MAGRTYRNGAAGGRHRVRRALALAAAVAVSGACTGPSTGQEPGAGAGTGAVAAAPLPPARPDPAAEAARVQEFRDWAAGFRGRALAAGIAAPVFDAAFDGIAPDPVVVERDRFQPEFTRPVWEYLDSAVSDSRIARGREMAARHAALMSRLEAEHGVDAAAVLAIWGLESAYGAVMGDMGVIRSLATLAHEGRRRDFGEEQLVAALRILQSGDTTPDRLRGSWAGAMGHTQFIPTSYLAYAVDATGDGRRDIWNPDRPDDALASTANYLARFGWERGAPTVVRVALPAGFDYTLADGSPRGSAADWAARGVATVSGAPIPPGSSLALILPAGAGGPAWLAWPNFRVILRYNNATSYALAVSLLAAQIARAPGAEAPGDLPWPRGQRALSRTETIELQTRLTALGYDTGGADGILGPNTRAAVRAFQRAQGLVPDGHVSGALLERVSAAGG